MATFSDDLFKKDNNVATRARSGSSMNANENNKTKKKNTGFAQIDISNANTEDMGKLRELVNSYSGDKRARAYDLAVSLAAREREDANRNGGFNPLDADIDMRMRTDRIFKELQADLPENERVSGMAMRKESPFTAATNFLHGGLNTLYNIGGGGIDWLVDRGGDIAGAITGDDALRQKIQNATSAETFAPVFSLGTDLAIMAANPLTAIPILAGKGLIEHSDDFQEALTGVDNVTAQELTGGQRAMKGASGALGTLLTALPGAAVAKNAGKAISKKAAADNADAIAKYTKEFEDLEPVYKEAAEAVKKAEDDVAATMAPVRAKRQEIEDTIGKLGGERYWDTTVPSPSGDVARMTYGVDDELEDLARLYGFSRGAKGEFLDHGRTFEKAAARQAAEIEKAEAGLANMLKPIETPRKMYGGTSARDAVSRSEELQAANRHFYTDTLSGSRSGLKPVTETSPIKVVVDGDGTVRHVLNEDVLRQNGYWQEGEAAHWFDPVTKAKYPANNISIKDSKLAQDRGLQFREATDGRFVDPSTGREITLDRFSLAASPRNGLTPAEQQVLRRAQAAIANASSKTKGQEKAISRLKEAAEKDAQARSDYASRVASRDELAKQAEDAEKAYYDLLYNGEEPLLLEAPRTYANRTISSKTDIARRAERRAAEESAAERRLIEKLVKPAKEERAKVSKKANSLEKTIARRKSKAARDEALFEDLGYFNNPFSKNVQEATARYKRARYEILNKALREGGYRAALKSLLSGEAASLGTRGAGKAAASKAAAEGAEQATKEGAEQTAKKGFGKSIASKLKGRSKGGKDLDERLTGINGAAAMPLVWGSMATQAGGEYPGGISEAMENVYRETQNGNWSALLPFILAATPAGKSLPISKRIGRAMGGTTTPLMAMKASAGMDAAKLAGRVRYTDEDEKNLLEALGYTMLDEKEEEE